MEPASFAVGIMGLAGLYNTCLDILNKFDSWKDCEGESQALMAQFKGHKLQLEKWGQVVGIENGTLSAQHDKLLDDPRTLSTVRDLLSAINFICGLDDPHLPFKSKRQRLSWALGVRMKRTAQVKQFSSIVQILYSLIPINAGATSKDHELNSRSSCARNAADVSHAHSDWIMDFRRILMRIESETEAETRRELQLWLLGNHIPNDRYEEYAEKRMEGTCEWVLSRSWFLDWSSPDFPNGSAKILWINGPAGFGKTVLSTKIIDHWSSFRKESAVYFFFSTDLEREDPFVAVRSWISQLASLPTAFKLAREMWASQQKPTITRKDLMGLLRMIILAIPGCTFIMDGLDECTWLKEHQKAGVSDSTTNFMAALMRVLKDSATRLLILSRDEPEIRNWLLEHGCNYSVIEHKITREDVQMDLTSYSRKIVYEELKKTTEVTKNMLSQKLADRCNGQFLWVRLQQESLRRNSWRSQKEIERAINSTPTGLGSIHEQNWMKITRLPEEDRERALSLLRWTAFSLRPLTVNEITEALLISENCDEVRDELPEIIDEEYIDKGISYYCGSLLEVRGHSTEGEAGLKTVHLAHFSVKQFLLYNIPQWTKFLQPHYAPSCFTEAVENTLLAKMCLRYLNALGARQKSDQGEDAQVLGLFLNYSAGSWQQHAALGDKGNAEVVELVNRLFDKNRRSWTIWRKWFDLNHSEGGNAGSEIEDSDADPVYYASLLGLTDTVTFLMTHDKHSANDKGFLGRTALVAACKNGHLRIAENLIANGAEVAVADRKGRSPIYLASKFGHLGVAKLLLEKGADVQFSCRGWTPVNVASENGHLEVVKLLLKNGADINLASDDGCTAMMMASQNGHLEVVEVLLKNGADTIRARNGWTPIIIASMNGHLDVVRLLTEKEADITATSYEGWTPVSIASRNGHLEVVKWLLEKGADATVTTYDGWTPINVASENGHLEVVEFLLKNGADIEFASDGGWTPINIASHNGHFEVVKLLLEKGAKVSVETRFGLTPLNSASKNGHLEIVKLLLETRANASVANCHGWTPINMASLNGRLEVVEFLLKNGADIEFASNDGWTPINSASQGGHLEVIKLLLKKGANASVATCDGWTPINTAAQNGHLKVVQLLLENGADITATNNSGWTPIYIASANGHPEIVQFLLEKGADIKVTANDGWTPINEASAKGHLKIVKLLLESGANVELMSDDGWTPVNVALNNGNLEVAKLLLKSGANINLTVKDGLTPIHRASSHGHLNIVKLLLGIGADINLTTKDGWTPIWTASAYNHPEVVKFLLKNGADIEFASKDGWTPINIASHGGHLEVVKLLLEKGANASVENRYGGTPLISASQNGHLEVVKLLLQVTDKSLEIRDRNGRTPLFHAAREGHCEVIRLLLSHDALPNFKDCYGTTPLCAAVRNGNEQVIQLLLPLTETMAGFEDGFGRNLIWWASKTGNVNVIDLVGQWARKMGIDFGENRIEVENTVVLLPRSSTWCDVCTRFILSGHAYYGCKDCFDFAICLECHRFDVQCFNPSHEWALHKPDGP